MSTEIETKERPILFSGPMVRAILKGRKTQTRRVIDLSPKAVLSLGQRQLGFTFNVDLARVGDVGKMISALVGKTTDQPSQQISVPVRHPDDAHIPWEDCGYERLYCPYGGPGDRLWVRETFDWFAGSSIAKRNGVTRTKRIEHVAYRADYKVEKVRPCSGKWTPSIHMPRWASRLTLEITGVRVQRIWQISESDSIAEGAPCIDNPDYDQDEPGDDEPKTHKAGFVDIWWKLYGEKSWWDNPWVWVIEFKRVTT